VPNKKTLTVDDFNPEKKVENYRLWLKAEGLQPGDQVDLTSYKSWIFLRAAEFKRINNLGEFTSIEMFGYEKYMDYLRQYAEEQSNTPKGQTSIYDFLEVAE